ncbi:NADPH-dependent FMN reductase [Bifidobacterium simiarum]|uniref:Flavin reductase n=1 Tax=Bifidobacterium simiarum TaxID=2045441 RepID=A0A2M9HGG4_9BIFI|nr:NADPH-dependent FMN reductase [Bifidobacterium simiarum]MBT1166641.1 NAD(P)H-dependent oxidoreductase [Bifidobacterium simiarum]PJM75905.1 flavin reductase [Bifidobacterium simiarum]
MTQLLFIVGSLHKNGFNHQLAEEAKKLVGDRAEVKFLDYTAVPFFDQDGEYPAPDAVSAVRREVVLADGVWIFSPEYNYSYPGLLKNLLDWLSRPLEPFPAESASVLAGKKIALSSVAGQSAGAGTRAKLTEVLGFNKAELLDDQVGVALAPEAWGTGELGLTDADREKLAAQADAFLKFVAE